MCVLEALLSKDPKGTVEQHSTQRVLHWDDMLW